MSKVTDLVDLIQKKTVYFIDADDFADFVNAHFADLNLTEVEFLKEVDEGSAWEYGIKKGSTSEKYGLRDVDNYILGQGGEYHPNEVDFLYYFASKGVIPYGLYCVTTNNRG